MHTNTDSYSCMVNELSGGAANKCIAIANKSFLIKLLSRVRRVHVSVEFLISLFIVLPSII